MNLSCFCSILRTLSVCLRWFKLCQWPKLCCGWRFILFSSSCPRPMGLKVWGLVLPSQRDAYINLRMCVFTRGLWFCPSGAVIKHFTVRNVAGAWYIDMWDATQVSRRTWTVDRRYNKNINELSFTNQYMISVVNCTSRAAISMRWEPSNYQALSWHAFGTPTVDAWDYKQVVKELLGLTSSKYTHASVKVTCVVKIRSRRCSNDSYLNWGSSWISIL